jgi:heat-inducible transcriptional repressor
MEDLDRRQKNVLRWIVQSYIRTASPVGSSHVVKQYRMQCSPATVRNEMSLLEKRGYIRQPHTSAGRVPTDQGYRFFVDGLMKPEPLQSEEKERIQQRMEKASGDCNRLLEEASAILGQVSRELGVVLTPWISWGIFDRLELIELTEKKILVVIHVQSRLVKTVILELEGRLESSDLNKAKAILNERLHGLTLEEIRENIGRRMIDIYGSHRKLLQRIVKAAGNLFDFSEPLEVHTFGTQNILTQPEFHDAAMLEPIFRLIDNKRNLIQLFYRKVEGTQVTIGRENTNESLKPFTVVVSSYNRGKDRGTLGIIGPTRMRYTKILPLLDYMASAVSHYLS